MPIRDFLQDEQTGGMAVVNGDFALVGGETNAQNLQAVRQALRIRLRMLKGDSYLNDLAGVDYLGKILVKNANPVTVTKELGANIAATPDVLTVKAAKLVGPDAEREASIDYTVTTPYGVISETVSGGVPQ